MSKSNSQVAHQWAHGQAARGSNLHSPDGITLISYNTAVACRIDSVIYLSEYSMSSSTSRHIHLAHQAVNHERDSIFYTRAFNRWNTPRLTHAGLLTPEASAIIDDLQTALDKPRTHQTTKEAAIATYNAKREAIQALATRLSVTLPDFPAISTDPGAIVAYHEAARQKAAKAEEAARAAALQRQADDAEQLRAWLTTGAGRYPSSYHMSGADQITIKKGYVTFGNQAQFSKPVNTEVMVVITSQGAEAPLAHVIKALKFWESRHYTDRDTQTGAARYTDRWTPYQTNGHKIHLGNFTLDSIAGDGTVKAGCHMFSAAEIIRFRNQWAPALDSESEAAPCPNLAQP